MSNAQIICPVPQGRRSTPGYDRDFDADFLRHLDAMTVSGVEDLVFLAVLGEVQSTVGQYAIDIQNQSADCPQAAQ
ncbi:MAG: hypothetical protein IE913_11170 [Halothiobacillus sp.]|nr:hypothetical protein [Halothiobacillus sp.]